MKQPVAIFRWRPFLVMVFLSLVSLVIWGQEDGSESPATTTANPIRVTENPAATWYTSPWVWIIGIAVFILLLLAILSSQSVAKTVRAPRTEKNENKSTGV